MSYQKSKNLLMAGTAVMLVFGNVGYANAAVTEVNGADVPISSDPNATPSIKFLTDNTAFVTDGTSITGFISSATNGNGTLSFDGSSTVYDAIGSTTISLKSVISNGNNKIVNFNGNVQANTISIVGSNTVNFGGYVYGNIDLGTAGATVTINNNKDIVGNIYSSTAGTGTLTINGGSDIIGAVGDNAGRHLYAINVGADASTSSFSGDVYTEYVNLTGDGSVTFNGKLDAKSGISFQDATKVTFNSDVTINNGTGSINFDGHDGTITLGSGVGSFNSDIDNTNSLNKGVGNLTVSGNTALGGNIGATNALKTVTVSSSGDVSFTGAVNTDTLIESGIGKTTISGSLNAASILFSSTGNLVISTGSTVTSTSGVNFSGHNGTLTIGVNNALTFNVDNSTDIPSGIISLEGGTQVVSGNIGSYKAISEIDVGKSLSTTVFTGNVNAANTNIVDTGSVTLQKGITGNVNFQSTGSLTLNNATNSIVNGNITTSTAGNGSVAIQGNAHVTGYVGGTTNIGSLTSATAAANLDFDGAVSANTITISGAGDILSFGGDVKSTTLMSITGASTHATFDAATNVTKMSLEGGSQSMTFGGTANIATLDEAGNNTTLTFNNTASLGDVTAKGDNFTINTSTGTLNATKLTAEGSSDVLNFGGATTLTTFNMSGAGSHATFSNTFTTTKTDVLSSNALLTFNGAASVGAMTVSGDNSTVNFNDVASGTSLTISGNAEAVTFAKTSNIAAVSVRGTGSNVEFKGAVTATTLDLAEDTSTAIFDSTVSTTTLNLLGTGSVSLKGNLTGTMNFSDGNGQINVASGLTIAGNVTTSTGGTGNVALAGDATITGSVGTSSKYINILTAGANNRTVAVSGSVYADTIAFSGTNAALNVAGAVGSDTVTISGISSDVKVTGAMTADTLTLAAADSTLTVGGTYFGSAVALNASGTSATFSGDVQGNTVITGSGTMGNGIGTVIFGDSVTAVKSVSSTSSTVLKNLTLSGSSDTVVVNGGNVIAADTTVLGNNTLDITNGTFTIGTTAAQTLTVSLTADTSKSGKIVSSGNAVVGSNTSLYFTVNPSEYVADNSRYVIVDGLTGSGTVSTLGTISGNNTLMISYTQDTTDKDDLVVVAKRKALSSFAKSDNASAVGVLLDKIGMNGNTDLDNVQIAIQTAGNAGSSSTIANILQSLTSTADGGAVSTNLNVGSMTQGINEGRMASMRLGFDDYNSTTVSGVESSSYSPEGYGNDMSGVSGGATMVNGYSFWVQGYGREAKQNDFEQYSGYNEHTYGTVVGVDTSEVFEDTIFGAAFAFGQAKVKSNNYNHTKTHIDNYSLSLYSNYDFNDNMFMDTQASYAYNVINSTRYNVGDPAAPKTAIAQYYSQQYSTKAVLGYDAWFTNGLIMTPTLSAAYTYLYNADYAESGAGGLGLRVDAVGLSALDLGAGLNLSTKMVSIEGDSVIKPSIHSSYTYDAIGDRLETNAVFSGGGVAFATKDSRVPKEKANMGAGIDYATDFWSVSAVYDYELRKSYYAHSAAVRMNLQF